MDELAVQSLIHDWNSLRDDLAPSKVAYQGYPASPYQVGWIGLTLISGRRDTWETFVCVAGYASATSSDPIAILDGMSNTPFPDPYQVSNAHWGENAFLLYASEHVTIGLSQIPPAGFALRYGLADNVLRNSIVTIDVVMECNRIYRDDPIARKACIDAHRLGP